MSAGGKERCAYTIPKLCIPLCTIVGSHLALQAHPSEDQSVAAAAAAETSRPLGRVLREVEAGLAFGGQEGNNMWQVV